MPCGSDWDGLSGEIPAMAGRRALSEGGEPLCRLEELLEKSDGGI